jgi:hypothetical protein
MALATSAVIGLIASGAMAAGNIADASAEKKQMAFQARVADQQAISERQVAADQERDYRKAQSARLAEFRAALGGSGTDSSTGTPLMALADFESETELNARRIRSGGDIRSRRLEEQSDFYGSAGKAALNRGYARAGASLLSGAGSSFSKPGART